MRRIRLGKASIIDVLVVLDLTLGLIIITELTWAIELPRATWHSTIRSLRLVTLILCLSIVEQKLLLLARRIWNCLCIVLL